MWRKTPQTQLIRELLASYGHATNQQLAAAARKSMPTITNTTVHRITSRLVEGQLAAYAPSLQSTKVIDANPLPHDHFLCTACHRLIDINLSKQAIDQLQSQLPGRLEQSNLLVAGVCQVCPADL